MSSKQTLADKLKDDVILLRSMEPVMHGRGLTTSAKRILGIATRLERYIKQQEEKK